MRPMLLIFFVASTLGLQGQTPTKATSSNLTSNTISGCLVFSAREYRLVDTAGNSTELQNQANRLIHYVGQQVQITGQPGIKTIGTTVDSLASSAEEVPVFNVAGVKGTGTSCTPDSQN